MLRNVDEVPLVCMMERENGENENQHVYTCIQYVYVRHNVCVTENYEFNYELLREKDHMKECK